MATEGVLYEEDLKNVNEMQRLVNKSQAPTLVKFMPCYAYTKGIVIQKLNESVFSYNV